jgi:hypothetical protein
MNSQTDGAAMGAPGPQSAASIAFVTAMAGVIDANGLRRASTGAELPGTDRHNALVTIAIEMGGALALTLDPALVGDMSNEELTSTLARAFGIGVELGLTVPH